MNANGKINYPQFVTQDYKQLGSSTAAKATFDLTEAETLVARNDYAGALANLRGLMPTIEGSGDAEALQRARSLMARSGVGLKANEAATNARAALLQGDYATAANASATGREQYDSIGQVAQADVMKEFAALAQRGIAAQQQLIASQALIKQFQITRAESNLRTAYTTFVELGDQTNATRAESLLTIIERGKQALALACFVCAAALIGLSTKRRSSERRLALPYS